MHPTKKIVLSIFALVCFYGSSLNAAFADETPPTPEEQAYKFRTSLFQTFSFKFGKLVAAKVAGDGKMFNKQAADLQYLASMLEEGFEIENSLPAGTEAKPVIWEDFSGFTEKAEVLRNAVAGLTQEGAMDSFQPREFGSKNCGGCHREYRVKKD